jgi:hypothetical protein
MARKHALWVTVISLAAALATRAGESAVSVTPLADRVVVRLDGQLFTEYVFAGTPRPYCYPLLGPGGVPLTRSYPMVDVPGEEHDHPHHRSLWFTHGQVNGTDFWSEAPGHGRIVHDRFLELASGAAGGVIRSANRWLTAAGAEVCSDERTLRFYGGSAERRQIDVEITLKAGGSAVVLGDTKEGSMALRLNEQMRVVQPQGKPGAGHILDSAGRVDGAAWGKRAAWCAYSGPVDGKTFTVAMFDHPQNPRYPTWWHVRDYGLFAANPFGQHDFEGAPARAGDLTLPAGGQITFRYRVLLLVGGSVPAALGAEFARWAVPVGAGQ